VNPDHAGAGVEWLCVRECLRFSRRHPRYFLIFLLLYWHSLGRWQSARAARSGFCFLQLYDDIMDGDRPSGCAPDVIAAQTISEWEHGRFAGDTVLSRLGAAFAAALRSLPVLPGDDPSRDVLILLQAMRRDAQRVADRVWLPAAELQAHLRLTFHHSVNLLLIAAQLQTRARHVPDLVAALGWCSVVRDLSEDLGKGLVNVPAEVARQVAVPGAALNPSHPEMQRWLAAERLIALDHLRASARTLQAITATDPRAARLLGMFHRSILRYATAKRREAF
jgi:phytoene/squalene synthetase